MKAPRWLTESFAQGIDERETIVFDGGLAPECWLARFDRGHRLCEGRFERFHYLGRQRVEKALGWHLWTALNPVEGRGCAFELDQDLLHLAAWDSRNGGIACEFHHRHFDKHLVSVPSEQIVVPHTALPEHVLEFASEWGLEDELAARFPAEDVISDIEGRAAR